MGFSIKRRTQRSQKGLESLAKLVVRSDSAVIPAYSRSEFGHGWNDVDKDGQDTRAEVLIEAHRPGRKKVKLAFATDKDKRVVSGRWRCRFTGEWVTDASKLDIDHLVPLADAWDSGAHAWDKDRRERYSNGVGVKSWRRSWLLPVTAKYNRAKGSRSPEEWLPPNDVYLLNYAADWIATKAYWNLSITQAEKDTLENLLKNKIKRAKKVKKTKTT